jgi:hypothetical protein
MSSIEYAEPGIVHSLLYVSRYLLRSFQVSISGLIVTCRAEHLHVSMIVQVERTYDPIMTFAAGQVTEVRLQFIPHARI